MIQQLQQLAGNRAVSQRLAGQRETRHVIQGKFDFSFTAKVGLYARLTEQHDRDFLKVIHAHDEYLAAKTPEAEYDAVVKMVKLAGKWLFTYLENNENRKKTDDLQRLIKLCNDEMPSLTQAVYMAKMERGGFEYITNTGKSAHRHNPQEQTFAQQHNLTPAELTAIKVYTAGDYQYINPIYARDDTWLAQKIKQLAGPVTKTVAGKQQQFPSQWEYRPWKSQVEQTGATDEQLEAIKQEGREHGDMALQALAKIPDWEGKGFSVYRGMGLPVTEIAKQFPEKGTITFKSFTSTSYKPGTAMSFAEDNAAGGKAGIFLIINTPKGKDITMFSEVKSEGEILLLPGSTFTVNKVTPPNQHEKVYYVWLTQTR